jgi:preprotein translocase subunit SecD
LVSKRNKHRKEAKKVKKIPEKPIEEKPIEEKKPELSMEQIVNAVSQKVTEALRPEVNAKLDSVANGLKEQLTNEMQDIRSHLDTPSTSGNGHTPEQTMTVPPIQDQQTLQGQPQENPMDNPMVSVVLRLLEMFLRPKPPQTNAQMFQTFEQASIRKNMAEMSMDDYINQAVKKQMVKKLLGENFDEEGYKKAESNADHYMKPLREAGEKAKKAEELAKSEKHE